MNKYLVLYNHNLYKFILYYFMNHVLLVKIAWKMMNCVASIDSRFNRFSNQTKKILWVHHSKSRQGRSLNSGLLFAVNARYEQKGYTANQALFFHLCKPCMCLTLFIAFHIPSPSFNRSPILLSSQFPFSFCYTDLTTLFSSFRHSFQ